MINHLVPGSVEWLEFRRNKIGASDVPIICEKAPWSSPYELWQEKLGLKENVSNAAMRRGSENEEKARARYEEVFGVIMFPKVVIHPKYTWLIATLDGLDLEGSRAVEIKSGERSYALAAQGIIPEYYQLQLQFQMECANIGSISYWAWLPERDPIHLKLERDPKIFSNVFPIVEAFWEHLKNKTPPDHIEERNDTLWCDGAKHYLEIRRRLKELETAEEDQRKFLIDLAQSKSCKGGGLVVKTSTSKGKIDYSRIPQLSGVNLEEYRGEPIQKWYFQEDSSAFLSK